MTGDEPNRRRVLALCGTGIAALLGGCSDALLGETPTGTPPPTDTSSPTPTGVPTDTTTATPTETPPPTGTPTDAETPSETGTPVDDPNDVTLVGVTGRGAPSNLQFNLFTSYRVAEKAAQLLYEPLAKYHYRTGEFRPYAATDWAVTDAEMTVTLRDDLVWHDGRAVTAGDLARQIRLSRRVDHAVWEYVTAVRARDERTVALSLAEETHPRILKHALLTDRIHAHPGRYERFEGGDGGSLTEFREREPLGNGPFRLAGADSRRFRLERFADHPLADRVTFTSYELRYLPVQRRVHRALLDGTVDAVTNRFTPPRVVADLPEWVREVRIPSKWGYGIVFNHGDEHFGTRAVRQAVAHLVNRERVVRQSGPRTKVPTPVPCGITVDDQARWLGAERSSYPDYGVGTARREAAADRMRSAGYERSGGRWVDGDGAPVSVDYYTPGGWSDWTTASQTVVDALNDFGFDVDLATVPYGELYGTYADGEFAVGALYWTPGASRGAFPYFTGRHQVEGDAIAGGHEFPRGGRTVPARDGSGTTTVDPRAKLDELETTNDPDEATTLVRDLAWHSAHDLPMLGITERLDQSFVATDDWSVPPAGADAYGVRWPSTWLVRTGALRADPSG
ncbi:ABC transporter substrate-binding protein [Halosimplex halobium]|uniref:ABC transporter substrate-binding protein n=1 Tax=Halosimplex halobium TaxID=3396618 RepID=UPI003F56728D